MRFWGRKRPTPWWLERPELPDVPLWRCPVKMRSLQAISCYWPCQLDDGHIDNHLWFAGTARVEFTTEQAEQSKHGPYGTVEPLSYVS